MVWCVYAQPYITTSALAQDVSSRRMSSQVGVHRTPTAVLVADCEG